MTLCRPSWVNQLENRSSNWVSHLSAQELRSRVCMVRSNIFYYFQVLRESSLWDTFEGGARPFPGAVILGDSAYPNRDWLVTPFPGDEVIILPNRIPKKPIHLMS